MFYLIEVTNYNNGTAEAKAIYPYETEDEAISKWHFKNLRSYEQRNL